MAQEIILAEHTQESLQETAEWKVHQAFYGLRDKSIGADCTIAVRRCLHKEGIIHANNSIVGDPCRGKRKFLFITLHHVSYRSTLKHQEKDARSRSPRKTAGNWKCSCGVFLVPHGRFCLQCGNPAPTSWVVEQRTTRNNYHGAISAKLPRSSAAFIDAPWHKQDQSLEGPQRSEPVTKSEKLNLTSDAMLDLSLDELIDIHQ